MAEKYYNSLSDMSRIKDSLMSVFYDSDDVVRLIMPTLDDDNFTQEQNWYGGTFEKNINGETKIIPLIGHCFDTPYIEGKVSDGKCAVFIETYLTRVESQRIKEVGVDITVVCHKDLIRLSDEDKSYFNLTGVYGNRVDCAIQVINSAILNHSAMDMIKEKYSIGNMVLAKENPLKQYIPDPNFYGKCLSYTYTSFYQRKNNAR